jgi:hypothetical protein
VREDMATKPVERVGRVKTNKNKTARSEENHCGDDLKTQEKE